MILKINMAMRSLLCMIFYYLTNRISRQVLSGKFNTCSADVSLTTYGDRINTVFYTIESVFFQSVKPKSITLYLSSVDVTHESELPRSLLRLKKRGLKIVIVEEDIRSYKKLYYKYLDIVENSKCNDVECIVTCDDDVFYSRTWLKELYNRFRDIPMAVICYRGKHITLDVNGDILPYKDWKTSFSDSPDLFMPTGVGGVLYPIKSLIGLNNHKNDFMELCSQADDVWFKCVTLSNGYGSYLVKENINTHPLPILKRKMKGLEIYNVSQNGNDIQLAKSQVYFKLNWSNYA